MTTALVIGARGMLGQEIAARLRAGDPGTTILTPSREQFDLADCETIDCHLEALQPTVVFNCAAMVQVDACETRFEEALRINAESPGRIAAWCAGRGATLVHVSTDYVFDGAGSSPIPEEHPTNPINRYGLSKLEGEERVLSAGGRVLMVRTAWLYAPTGNNFYRFVMDGLGSGRVVPVIDDQVGSPTYAADAAEGILTLVSAGAEGIYHVVNAGACAWAEFAAYLQHRSGLEGSLKKIAGSSLARSARRPAYTVLSTERYRRTVHRPMRSWTEAADACLADSKRCV